MFEQVVNVLQSSYYDVAFRRERLPALVEEFRAQLASDPTTNERDLTRRLLTRIPASHLALLSHAGKAMLEDELFGRAKPTLGMQVMEWRGGYYAAMVLAAGPAAEAGIRNWDEIVAIDGAPVAASARLDWRTDDAHLDDDRDPAMHAVLVAEGDAVSLTIARAPEATHELVIEAAPYSAIEAARRSARIIERDGRKLGYIRFWYLHLTGVPEALEQAFDTVLAECEGLILDLRGRGGSAPVVPRLLRLIERGLEQRYAGPVVALIDRQARSGKEALAYELRTRRLARLVGEPTAGAVIPAAFVDVGDAILMFPSMALPVYTELLELEPTPPDVVVEWGGPYSGDRDPILEAGATELAAMIASSGAGRVVPAWVREATLEQSAPPVVVPALGTLVERMTEAYGGREALERHTSFTGSGTARIIDTPLSGSYSVEIHDSTFHSTTTLGAGITLVQHRDAAGVWITAPGVPTPRPTTGVAAIPIVWQSLLRPPLALGTAFPEAAVEGLERCGDAQCVRVRLGGAGDQAAFLLVDAATWLPRALRFRGASPVGRMDVVTYFKRYRDVDGVMVTDHVVTDAGAQQSEIVLTEMTFNGSAP
jgi:C-terminal processing protease CtpA/Prc